MANLFFSYSHKDEELRNELETHLALLKRQGVISAWHDRRITAGGNIDQEINSELETAQIILLLISADFLASDYCYDKEMTRALEKHDAGSATVIPVILRPCDWHSAPFGKLRATPTDGKSVSMYANQDEAFTVIAKDIRQCAEQYRLSKPESPSKSQSGQLVSQDKPERSSNLRVKRKFDDHERDEFLDDSYEYIARYFEGSLEELANRNPQIKTRFKRVDATSFTASIYDSGDRVAECTIWYGDMHGGFSAIYYSDSAETRSRNSYNDQLGVVDDGYTLQLQPLMNGGLTFHQYYPGQDGDKGLSQQGAAEYYWSSFIRRVQE